MGHDTKPAHFRVYRGWMLRTSSPSGAGRKMFLDIPFYRTGVYTNNDPEGYLRDDLLVVVSVTAMLQQLVVIVRCEAWFAPTLSREQPLGRFGTPPCLARLLLWRRINRIRRPSKVKPSAASLKRIGIWTVSFE